MKKGFFKRVARSIPLLRDILEMKATLWSINSNMYEIRAMNATKRIELECRLNPRYADPLRLHNFSHQVNSQNGEDGIIREIFRRVGVTNRSFVEIGVGNGVENNTAFLIAQGWTGYWIDGDDSFVPNIQKWSSLPPNALHYSVSIVTRENVTDILTHLGVPSEFDLLSIDIDQNTFYIWEALSGYSPRLVVIEYNSSIPADLDWKVHYEGTRVWDGTFNFGASLKALERLGRRLGYSLVGCDFIGVNAFFVRDDLAGRGFAEPFTAENHYEPPRFSYGHRLGHRRSLLDGPMSNT